MAKLTSTHQRFIVQRLACFETPTEIRAALQELHGVDASLPQILYYDPKAATGDRLSAEWKELFEETRARFVEDTSTIACAHRSYRLRRIQRLLDDSRHARNPILVKELLREAREEVKGVDITGLIDFSHFTEEELERVMRGEDPLQVVLTSRARRHAAESAP